MKRSLITLLFLALFGTMSTSYAVDNNQKKCFGKMHACFGADTDLVIDLNPTAAVQCVEACNGFIGGTGATVTVNEKACTPNQCELRCVVAFGLSPEICE